jgi:hypothetical protein
MNHKEKEQGYKFSNLKLNAYLKEIDNWNLTTYQERNKWMLNRFKKIWVYPEVEIDLDDIDADEDYNIFNAPDPKHKKLDYFIFRDEKIETKEVSNMYTHVIEKLFNENPIAFSHPDVGGIIQMTTSRETLRTYHQINAIYYIEVNLDSNTKFSRLKKLLTRFNAEEDLLINFSNGDPGEIETLKDREFWESKSNPEGMRVLDEVAMLLQSIEANLKLNFVYSYIGIIENTIAQNFAIFYPKQSFIRAEILVSNPGEWNQKLQAAGFKVVSIGKRSGRIKFRINGENLILHSALITEILQQSFREWNG